MNNTGFAKAIIDKIIDNSNIPYNNFGIFIETEDINNEEKIRIFNKLISILVPEEIEKYKNKNIEYAGQVTSDSTQISKITFILIAKDKLSTGSVRFAHWTKTFNKDITVLDIQDLNLIFDVDDGKISVEDFLKRFGNLSSKVNNFK